MSFTLISAVSDGGDCPQIITRTYEIADLCGNTARCEQLVTINDTIPPMLTCPMDTSVQCDIVGMPVFTDLAEFESAGGSVFDSCGIDPLSFILISESSDGNSCPEIISRVYQISDQCGNTASCTHVIMINDTIPPEMSCPSDINTQCSIEEVPMYESLIEFVNAGGSVFDSCGIDTLSFTIMSELSDNDNCPETISRVYMIADLCGNTTSCEQIIIVSDTVAPMLTCPDTLLTSCSISDVAVFTTMSEFITAGGTVFDSCGIDSLSFTLIGEQDNGSDCPKLYTRTYEISDLCGNTSICEHKIIVNDTIPPTISCPLG
jgi:hypothetical protein